METVTISGRVSPEQKAKLRQRAALAGRKPSQLVADAVTIYLSDSPVIRDAITELDRLRSADPFTGRLD